MSQCSRCRERYAQRDGLCRRCGREAGVYTMNTREMEAERLRKHQPKWKVEPRQRVNPVRVVQGVEYEVVFDGT